MVSTLGVMSRGQGMNLDAVPAVAGDNRHVQVAVEGVNYSGSL